MLFLQVPCKHCYCCVEPRSTNSMAVTCSCSLLAQQLPLTLLHEHTVLLLYPQVSCYECLPVIGGVYAKSYDHTTLTTSRYFLNRSCVLESACFTEKQTYYSCCCTDCFVPYLPQPAERTSPSLLRTHRWHLYIALVRWALLPSVHHHTRHSMWRSTQMK